MYHKQMQKMELSVEMQEEHDSPYNKLWDRRKPSSLHYLELFPYTTAL